MGIYTAPRYDSFASTYSSTQTKKQWDPIDTLEIINPDRCSLTCVGYAPSCGRRCRNPINQANRSTAFRILEDLSKVDPAITNIRKDLRSLAEITLCVRYHRNQVDSVVAKWEKEIREITSVKVEIKVEATFEWDSVPESKSDQEDFWKEEFYRLKKEFDRLQQERKDAEQGAKERAKREERERKEKERIEKEREDKEREKKERKRREAEEKRRREQERERAEREAREREEQRERIRQKAKRAREERERKANETAQKEREEWDRIWLNYGARWDELKKNEVRATSTKLRELIPWPVRTGNWKDVTEQAVKEFYQKALPSTMNAKKTFMVMQLECLKWHTDRIPKMFGAIEDTSLAGLFKTVIQVAIEVRAKAAEEKCKSN